MDPRDVNGVQHSRGRAVRRLPFRTTPFPGRNASQRLRVRQTRAIPRSPANALKPNFAYSSGIRHQRNVGAIKALASSQRPAPSPAGEGLSLVSRIDARRHIEMDRAVADDASYRDWRSCQRRSYAITAMRQSGSGAFQGATPRLPAGGKTLRRRAPSRSRYIQRSCLSLAAEGR